MAKKKATEPKAPKSDLPKSMGLFDHINNIKGKKTLWKDFTESDRKTWSTYMVNRFLSMNMDYIELVNQLQKYTMSIDNHITQRLYCEVLPYDRSFSKYVKGKNENKYDSELVNIIRKYYLYNSDEAEEYIDMILKINPKELVTILKKFGKTEKDIKKLIEV